MRDEELPDGFAPFSDQPASSPIRTPARRTSNAQATSKPSSARRKSQAFGVCCCLSTFFYFDLVGSDEAQSNPKEENHQRKKPNDDAARKSKATTTTTTTTKMAISSLTYNVLLFVHTRASRTISIATLGPCPLHLSAALSCVFSACAFPLREASNTNTKCHGVYCGGLRCAFYACFRSTTWFLVASASITSLPSKRCFRVQTPCFLCDES